MIWLFPWALLFFFLVFCGIFILVFYYTKTPDRAIRDIMCQQRAVRLELDRLATALDALLADRPLNEDEPDASGAMPEEALPGLDRLLLWPSAGKPGRPAPDAASPVSAMASAATPDSDAAAGLPDLKL